MLVVSLHSWQQARDRATPLRFAVFVEEQRVPAEIELDEHDASAVHALAIERSQVIGTGRLLASALEEGLRTSHIGRMAVARSRRGEGIGGQILAALLAEAARRGDEVAALSAQLHALGFYLEHGFIPYGGTYMEAGIEHRAMRKRLR